MTPMATLLLWLPAVLVLIACRGALDAVCPAPPNPPLSYEWPAVWRKERRTRRRGHANGRLGALAVLILCTIYVEREPQCHPLH
jgi:hypothetical protein